MDYDIIEELTSIEIEALFEDSIEIGDNKLNGAVGYGIKSGRRCKIQVEFCYSVSDCNSRMQSRANGAYSLSTQFVYIDSTDFWNKTWNDFWRTSPSYC